jgi:hypothetical protein
VTRIASLAARKKEKKKISSPTATSTTHHPPPTTHHLHAYTMAAGSASSAAPQDQAELIAHDRRMRELAIQIQEAELERIRSETIRNRGGTPGSDTVQGEKAPFFIAHPEVQAAKFRFPGINLVQLDRIYKGSFDPSNLSKIRRLGGPIDDSQANTISIEDGQIRSEPAKGKSKDFGNNSDIWREGFLNYFAAILFFFNGSITPALGPAILGFYQRIEALGKIYKWQEAVLPLALEHHTDVMARGQTSAEVWPLPEDRILFFCHSQSARSAGPQQSVLPTRSSKRPRADTRPASDEVCSFWNTGACPRGGSCPRRHQCAACDGDHPLRTCKTKQTT